MRNALLAIALVVGGSPCAVALEPKAGLRGPDRVNVGDPILIQFVDCIGEHGPFLKCTGPEKVNPTVLYTRDNKATLAVAYISTPGIYQFVVVTTGFPSKESDDLEVAVASWQVTVVGVMTSPVNGTTPGPPPAQAVTPVPTSIRLFAIAVYSPAADLPELRADTALATSMKVLNVEWKVWADGPIIDRLQLRGPITKLGKMPALLIYDDAGRVYDANGASTDSAIPAPTRSAEVISMFRRIRGQP